MLLLLVLGAGMEAIILIGWLWPMSLWEWRTNLPAGAPLVLIYGQNWTGALTFALPTLALAVCWGAALLVARRVPAGFGVPVALAFSALFIVTLLPLYPGGTQDIYHNVADGRLVWLHGVNPTLTPPNAYPDDPFIRHVWGYADLPSAYGPLWYALAGLPTVLAGDGQVANLLAHKVLTGAFMFGAVVLVALTARALVPGRAVGAVVLAGWGPLFLFESAGNGHNDSLMAFFLAATLLAAARGHYRWVLPLLTLSVLIKYTTALVGPVALIWLLRQPAVHRRDIIFGTLASALLAVLAFAPLYAGRDTVAALQRPGMTFILSPATLLHGWLAGALTEADASLYARLITGVLFAVVYLRTLLGTRGDAAALAARGFDVLFAYLLLASWWFWPWYLTWCAPAAALTRGWARPAALAAATTGGLLTYLYWWPDPAWRSGTWFAAYSAVTVGVFLLPATLWIGGALVQRWRTGRATA